MEKNSGWLAVVLVIMCLIVGYTTGYVMAPEKVETITNTEIVEVPTEVTVTETVEVEVISTDTKPLLDTAIADFLKEVDDDRALQYCDRDRYDEDQIKVKDIDYYAIVYDEDDFEDSFGVVFGIELKYLDKDVEEKCYVDYEVFAYYEDDEDVEVEFSIIA